MKKIILAIWLLIALGCSQGGSDKKGDQGFQSKLDQSQKAFEGQDAIFEASQNLNRSVKHLHFDSLKLTHANVSASSVDAKSAKIAHVQQALNSNKCQINIDNPANVNAPPDSAAKQLPRMKLKVSGSGCPMELILDMDFGSSSDVCAAQSAGTQCKFNFIIKMSYRVIDQKLSELLGIKSGSMNMGFNIDQLLPNSQQSSAQMVMKMSNQIDIKVNGFDNQLHLISGSQSMFMKMNMSGPQNSSSGTSMDMTKPEASLKESLIIESAGQKTSMSADLNSQTNSERYEIDGVSVSADVYKSEHKKIENKFFAKMGDGDPQGSAAGNPASGGQNPADPLQVQ